MFLGEVHPLLDFRRYKVTRNGVYACRRAYRSHVRAPFREMWAAPKALLNVTILYSSNAMNEPDTHEYRLLKAAEEKINFFKKNLDKKIEEAAQLTKRDYGNLITVERECFSSAIDKYNYKVCPLKDVRQDSVSLGSFEGWTNKTKKSYKIGGGTKCYGVTEVDAAGKTVQASRCGEATSWKKKISNAVNTTTRVIRFACRRSGTVSLKCGTSHAVVRVTENSPCVYEIDFQTFLACDEEEIGIFYKQVEDTLAVADMGDKNGGDETKKGGWGWMRGRGDEDREAEQAKAKLQENMKAAQMLLEEVREMGLNSIR